VERIDAITCGHTTGFADAIVERAAIC